MPSVRRKAIKAELMETIRVKEVEMLKQQEQERIAVIQADRVGHKRCQGVCVCAALALG